MLTLPINKWLSALAPVLLEFTLVLGLSAVAALAFEALIQGDVAPRYMSSKTVNIEEAD